MIHIDFGCTPFSFFFFFESTQNNKNVTIEIDCGSPGELHNGWLENTESGTGLGATIIYRCQDGMLLVGNSSTVCLADGQWRYPPPLCLGELLTLAADMVA